MSRVLKLGSRKSSLAKLQSYVVAEALRKAYPGIEIEYNFRESMGDRDLTTPLWKMGNRGVFTQDFVEDLKSGKLDFVVHSWKDLELEATSDSKILSVLERADQRDLLLVKREILSSPSNKPFVIYTSSPRREYNLSRFLGEALPYPHQTREICFEAIRGNIQTRLRKWMESDREGFVIAKAALDRILRSDFPEADSAEYADSRKEIREILAQSEFMILPLSENPNAPAQGGLAVEVRSNDHELIELFSALEVEGVGDSIREERRVLSQYGGGCHQKIGVAVLNRPFGKISIERGMTDSGVVLDRLELETGSRIPKPKAEKQIWPDSIEKGIRSERISLSGVVPPGKYLWVSRADAWPEDWNTILPGTIVWTAGWTTWKRLAKKGVWVHGTADGFGEDEPTGLEVLVGESPKFYKLTHNRSEVVPSKLERHVTYELGESQIGDGFEGKTHFYWMSGTAFDTAISQNPEIRNAYHGCGPGITYNYIKEKVPAGNISVFLNFRDFMNYCKQEK